MATSRKTTTSQMTKPTTGSTALTTGSTSLQTMATSGSTTSQVSTSTTGLSISQLSTSRTGPSTSQLPASSTGPTTSQLSTSTAGQSTSQLSTSTAGPSTSQLSTSAAGPSTSQLSTLSAGPSTSGSSNLSSGHMNITEEESLFLRLTYLILNIGPKAVRKMIDQHIPSSYLKQRLANETGKLQKLKQKRVINTNQWDILYPTNGTANSNDFDMTLMIVLLREVVNISEPRTGWNNLPNNNDQSDGARIATMKFYRNELAHTTSGSISKTKFTKVWNDLQQAIVGIGGPGFAAEITQLLTTPLDQSHKDLYRELKNLVHDIVVPPNMQCYLDQKIDAWTHEDRSFVSTRATDGVIEYVNQNNVTIVTGPPGSGKSATIHHIALQYKQKGYQIFYVRTVDKIFDLWVPDSKQVFLLDDPFDVHDIDKSELHRWKTFKQDMVILFKYSCMKILASVRSHIINDQLLTFLSDQSIDITKPDMCLTNDERQKIFTKHALCHNRTDLLSMSSEVESYTISCFPLLCKRFTANKESRYSTEDFFNKPLQIIGKELKEFKINEKIRYFCLLFCMMYDSNLDTTIISLSCRDKKSRTIRESLLDICELPTSLSKTEIKSKLDTLLDTYLKKEGSSYQFIHDIIYDAVVEHANQLSLETKKEVILKHCTSRFIKDRTVLSPLDIIGESAGKIVINEELEDDWGIHIINSVREGKWGDVFANACLQTDKADIVLARTLQNFGKDCIRSFVTNRNIKSKEGIVSYHFLSPLTDPIERRLSEAECSSLHLVVLCGLVNLTKLIISSVDVANENSYINLLLLACLSGKENMVTLLKGYGLNTCCMDELTPLFLSSGKGNKRIVELLIEYGASVNIVTKFKQSPLHVAAQNGHLDIVNLLIERESDINMVDDMKCTALYMASKNGHVDIVNALINTGCNVDITGRLSDTALYQASRNGHVDIVNALINAGCNVDITGMLGYTALHQASENGHVDIVNALIKARANVDITGMFGDTALHKASGNGHVNIVNALIKAGANVNITDSVGDTALHMASWNGHVDITGRFGYTALYLASREGHIDIVNALIKAGANVDITNSYGDTALYLASMHGHVDTVNALIKACANVDITGRFGYTALHKASMNGHVDIVKALIKKGANVGITDMFGYTALHQASMNGHVDIVKALIKAGANVGITDRFGYTALHQASMNGHVDIVKALIKAGANVDITNSDGDTALHLGSANGHVDIVNALIKAGANVDITGSGGFTALHLASDNGHVNIVKALTKEVVKVGNADSCGNSAC